MSLTKQADVHRLAAPISGERLYFDEGKPGARATGLALRVRSGGSRRWVYLYRLGGRQLKFTIGDASAWSLDDARTEARRLRVKVDKGENPATAKAERAEASTLLFSSVVDAYLKAKAKTWRPRTLEEYTRHFKGHWKPFRGLALGSVTRSMVAARLRTIGEDSGPVAADRARTVLSTLYGWALGEGYEVVNPAIGTNRQSSGKARDRVLSDAELVTIWRAAPDDDYGRIVKLLMLTGQRRAEIGGLMWSEVDVASKLIALPGARTKNGQAHVVPLSDMALDVLSRQHRRLGRDAVFGEGNRGAAGWSRHKRALDAVAKLDKPWTLHDLRRTAATRMADLGVQPHVVEAVLNHVSGHRAGVAGIYNRATYAAEKRAALDLMANHLKVELAKAEGANIHRLTGRG